MKQAFYLVTDINRAVGLSIVHLRKQKRLSVRSLATASGVERFNLMALEQGEKTISVATMYLLTQALGVSMEGFMCSVERALEGKQHG